MENKELAAQVAKELTIEIIRKYTTNVEQITTTYGEFFDSVMKKLEKD